MNQNPRHETENWRRAAENEADAIRVLGSAEERLAALEAAMSDDEVGRPVVAEGRRQLAAVETVAREAAEVDRRAAATRLGRSTSAPPRPKPAPGGG